MFPSPSLRRHLSLRDLVAYGLLFIGPLAPVGVFGVLDARTDGAVALVYLCATIVMAFTAWSYAQMSRLIPQAGSVFAYVAQGIGPGTGFIAGWLAMLDYLLIPSVAYLFSGIALHALVPAVPAWVFTVLAFGITTAFNLAGVGVAARAGSIVLAAEIAVLAIFVVAALAALAPGGAVRPPMSAWAGMNGVHVSAVIGAVSIAVLSFLGFDAIASFAEENAGESRNVGVAIAVCLVSAGVVFIGQTWLGTLLSATPPDQLAAHPEQQGAAFYAVTRVAIGSWMSTVLAATKAVGPAFAAMTAQAAAARLLFAMAREGRLPRSLAQIDGQRGVPRAALLASAAITLVVAGWAAMREDGLDVLVSIVDVGALSAFTLLHASVLGYFLYQRRAPATLAHWIVPTAGMITTLWVIVESSTQAKAVAAVWLFVGVVVTAVKAQPPVAS